MKKYILPILTAAVLSLTACNEDAARVTETVEATTNEIKKVETIQKQTPRYCIAKNF